LELPLGQADVVDLMSPAELTAASSKRAPQDASADLIALPPTRVLVVDDGEANRRLIELVLSRAGANVVTAANGLEAIECIAEEAPALVLMDMQMPVLDGYTAARRLRESGFNQPIIALTGNAMLGDREKCIDAGCDDFMTKPINIDKLLQLVSSYLGQAPQAPVARQATVTPESSIICNAMINRVTGSQSIIPTLPMDDDDFRAITGDFVDRLPGRLDAIERAIKQADFTAVHGDAHWLKGAGGTVGLAVFTDPARTLEQAAIDQEAELALQTLKQIRDLQSRVVIPGRSSSSNSMNPPAPRQTVDDHADVSVSASERHIVCSLPLDDPEFYDIVRGFIARMDTRLPQMREELMTGRFDDLAQSAHWLKGAGGTVGYDALTQPARNLIAAAHAGGADECIVCIEKIEAIRARMVVPELSLV
jgi:CheY-like chemotaxis protein/HPt (histidine-containing phosphotransfer) domain-containing protein